MFETIASMIPVNNNANTGFVFNYTEDSKVVFINIEVSLLGLKKDEEYCINYTIKNSRNQIAIAQSAILPTVESTLSDESELHSLAKKENFKYQELPDKLYGTVATLSTNFAKDFFDNKQSKIYAELLDSIGDVLSTKETVFYISTDSNN